MKIYSSLLELTSHNSDSFALTLGNFDGVHLGHQNLIKRIKESIADEGLKLALMTFVPHPQKILKPNMKGFLITSYVERRKYLEDCGVDFLIECNFDRDFSTLKAESFLQEKIFCSSHLRKIFLGHDFNYGSDRLGNFELAQLFAEKRGIKVFKQEKFLLEERRISSSLIREMIVQGNVQEVQKFLTRPYKLEGMVIKGQGRGKKFGFPTANISFETDLVIPQSGVYFTRTHRGGNVLNSITNIGYNPTVELRNDISIETHILDFNDDLYGENLLIDFIKKHRSEMKFSSIDLLVNQVNQDIALSKKFFNV